jgi:protease-4
MKKIITDILLGAYRVLHTAFMIIILGVIAVILTAAVFVSKLTAKESVKLGRAHYLVIEIDGYLLEQRRAEFLSSALLNEHYARDIAAVLEASATDDRIKAVVFDLRLFKGATSGAVNTVLDAVEEYKESGKKLYSYAGGFRTGSYWLSSLADEIWLDPLGSVAIDGIALQNLYFKSALDRYGLTAYVSRAGLYKSAVEPLLADSMSEASREVNRAFIADFWAFLRETLMKNRNISGTLFDRYVNERPELLLQNGGNGALLASEYKLIEFSAPYNDFKTALVEKNRDDDGEPTALYYKNYLERAYEMLAARIKKRSGSVAVIYAEGMITGEEQRVGIISGRAYAELVTAAADDDAVGAIVIRLNSGGGDVEASETIYRAITAAKEKKPVLISMSDVAASGAYWLSLAASEIWAEPTTLTGSIGVFSYFVSAHQFLTDHGVYTDGVATTPQAYGLSAVTVPTPEALSLMQSGVNFVYGEFLKHLVEAGRSASPAAADAVAQGRIYSSARARELNLVDSIGTLKAVVKRAAELAEITDNYTVEAIEPAQSRLMSYLERILVGNVSVAVPAFALPAQLRRAMPVAAVPDGRVMAVEPLQPLF